MAKRIQPVGNVRPRIRVDENPAFLKEGEVYASEYDAKQPLSTDVARNLTDIIARGNPYPQYATAHRREVPADYKPRSVDLMWKLYNSKGVIDRRPTMRERFDAFIKRILDA